MAFEVGAIQGRLELDRTPFQQSLRAAREEARKFSAEHITPTVDLGDKAAKAQIDELRAKLARLSHERVNVKVDVDRSALSRIQGLLGGAGKGIGGIPVIGGLLSLPLKAAEGLAGALDKLPRLFEQVGQFATTAFQTVAGTINDLRTGATTVTQVLGSLLSGLISVVASAGAGLVAFGALVVVFGAVASAVVSLVAALAALAASLAAAVAGATALFIGAFAAALPVIGVLVAFFVRLAAVVKAHQAAQQAATQAVQQHKAALQAQHQAVLNLAGAQDNLKTQTVAAFQAMKQSAVDYQHALLGVESSKLGIEGARLSLRQAKRDLKDFLTQAAGTNSSKLFQAFTNVDFNPESARKIFEGATGKAPKDPLQLQEKLFAVQQALLGIKQANQSYQDSLNTLNQSEQKHAAFLQQGLNAYAPYANALKQVAQAQDRLHTATTRVGSAQTAYQQKLKALSSTETGFLGTLQKILKTFGDIAKAVAAPIFAGIERGFGSIQKLVSDPQIQRGLVNIGRAIGDVIARFAKTLDTKPWRSAITQFINAGATLTRQGGKLFTGIFNVLREIAQAALPHVINGVKSLAGWFTDLGKRPGAIKNAVTFLVHQFHIWWDVAKALGGLVVAFLRNAAGAGGKLAGHLAAILRHWTDWLNKHPGAVKRFFNDAVAQTSSLATNLGKVVGFMGKIIGFAERIGNTLKHAGVHSLWDLIMPLSPHTGARNFGPRVNLDAPQNRKLLNELNSNTDHQRKRDAQKLERVLGRTSSAGRSAHGGGSVIQNFNIHGVTDPQHLASTLAPKVKNHPGFKKAAIHGAHVRGK